MNIVNLIQKEDSKLPDYYTISVTPFSGQDIEYKVVRHVYIEKTGCYEFLLNTDELLVIPTRSVQSITFKKDYILITELNNKRREDVNRGKSDIDTI